MEKLLSIKSENTIKSLQVKSFFTGKKGLRRTRHPLFSKASSSKGVRFSGGIFGAGLSESQSPTQKNL
jgi:hypothetical protein